MPVKKRAAKSRPHRVTPEARAAFSAGDATALHLALALPPWVVSPLEVDDGPAPWRAGSAGATGWSLGQELREELQDSDDRNCR